MKLYRSPISSTIRRSFSPFSEVNASSGKSAMKLPEVNAITFMTVTLQYLRALSIVLAAPQSLMPLSHPENIVAT